MIFSSVVTLAILCSLLCYMQAFEQPVEITGIFGSFNDLTPRKEAVIYRNLPYSEIFEHEIADGNTLTSSGAVAIDTGRFTGRSPKDKYIVKRSPSAEHVRILQIN